MSYSQDENEDKEMPDIELTMTKFEFKARPRPLKVSWTKLDESLRLPKIAKIVVQPEYTNGGPKHRRLIGICETNPDIDSSKLKCRVGSKMENIVILSANTVFVEPIIDELLSLEGFSEQIDLFGKSAEDILIEGCAEDMKKYVDELKLSEITNRSSLEDFKKLTGFEDSQ